MRRYKVIHYQVTLLGDEDDYFDCGVVFTDCKAYIRLKEKGYL